MSKKSCPLFDQGFIDKLKASANQALVDLGLNNADSKTPMATRRRRPVEPASTEPIAVEFIRSLKEEIDKLKSSIKDFDRIHASKATLTPKQSFSAISEDISSQK